MFSVIGEKQTYVVEVFDQDMMFAVLVHFMQAGTQTAEISRDAAGVFVTQRIAAYHR